MRPGVALAGMAALMLAMLGRMGALDWLPEVAFGLAIAGGIILFIVLLVAVGAAVLMIPALAIIVLLKWAWPSAKPGDGGTAKGLACPRGWGRNGRAVSTPPSKPGTGDSLV